MSLETTQNHLVVSEVQSLSKKIYDLELSIKNTQKDLLVRVEADEQQMQELISIKADADKEVNIDKKILHEGKFIAPESIDVKAYSNKEQRQVAITEYLKNFSKTPFLEVALDVSRKEVKKLEIEMSLKRSEIRFLTRQYDVLMKFS